MKRQIKRIFTILTIVAMVFAELNLQPEVTASATEGAAAGTDCNLILTDGNITIETDPANTEQLKITSGSSQGVTYVAKTTEIRISGNGTETSNAMVVSGAAVKITLNGVKSNVNYT